MAHPYSSLGVSLRRPRGKDSKLKEARQLLGARDYGHRPWLGLGFLVVSLQQLPGR